MADKKSGALALLSILRKYSDEEHILSVKQIQDYLLNIYDLSIERRTIYAHIQMLISFNYDISTYEENNTGYYLRTKEFSKAEILLLCNAVHASHFISRRQSDQLIAGLLDILSKYERKEFSNQVYLPNLQKTGNTELLENIRVISMAIRNGHAIEFTYLHYNERKQLVPRRNERYCVQPFNIVFNNTRAYMICVSSNHTGYSHYRIDRMSKTLELNEGIPVAVNPEQDAYEYAKSKLFMFSGKSFGVSLKCKKRILDAMIDEFGTEIMISPVDLENLLIHVHSNEDGILLFAQQYLDAVQIVEPIELREKLKKRLSTALKEYN